MVLSLQPNDFQIVSSALDDSILIWDFFLPPGCIIDVELNLCILLLDFPKWSQCTFGIKRTLETKDNSAPWNWHNLAVVVLQVLVVSMRHRELAS